MLYKDKIMEEYHLSHYIINVNVGPDNFLFYSCMSGSVIELNKLKANSLKKFNLDEFNDFEIDKLIKMGFITKRNEFNDLEKLRNMIVDTRDRQSLGLTILTTTGCNANCAYCFEKGISKKTLSTETADDILSFIKKNYHEKPMHISWFGGEPLLNSSIISYISKKLKNSGIIFNSTMISNGFLLNNIKKEEFYLWNLKKVQITLDGVYDDYDLIKNYNNCKNAFARVISNIEYLLSCGIKTVIRINYNPDNIDTSIKTIDWIYNKFGSCNPLLYVYCVNIFSDDVTHVNKMAIDINNPYILITKKLIECGYITSLKQLGFVQKKNFCGIYNNYYVINSDGKIFKCEHTCNDEKEIIGDIKDGIIDSEKEKKWLVTSLPSETCELCEVLPCCQGNCKSLINEYGLEQTCLQIKKFGEMLLKMYYNYYKEVK